MFGTGHSVEAPKAAPRKTTIQSRIEHAINKVSGAADKIKTLEGHKDQLEGRLGFLEVTDARNKAQIADLSSALEACRAEVAAGRDLNGYLLGKLNEAESVNFDEFVRQANKFVDSIFEHSDAPPPYAVVLPARSEVGTAATAAAATVVNVYMRESSPPKPAPRFVPSSPVKIPELAPAKPMSAVERMRAANALKAQDALKKKQEQADMMQAVLVANSASTISEFKKREQTIEALRTKINANRALQWTAVKDWFMDKMAEKAQLEVSTHLPEAAKRAALATYPAVRNLQNAACAWLDVEAKNPNGITYHPNKEFASLLDAQNAKMLKELNELGCPDQIYHFLSLSKFEELDPDLSDPKIKEMLYVKKPIPQSMED